MTSKNSYKLLMKVDSNTRGNSYWFQFKVRNFEPGKTVQFTILNFTRSIHKFYRENMNVMVKRELDFDDDRSMSLQSEEDEPYTREDEWRVGQCTGIEFGSSPVLRNGGTNATYNDYYYKLSFEYEFKKADEGHFVYFSYAKPYGYSELIRDLAQVRTKLLRQMPNSKGDQPKMITSKKVSSTSPVKN